MNINSRRILPNRYSITIIALVAATAVVNLLLMLSFNSTATVSAQEDVGKTVTSTPTIQNGRIAFTRNLNGNLVIYTISADGTGEQRVTSHPADNFAPSYSRDGTRIAFTSSRNGNNDVYVINADGTNEQQVTTDPGIDFAPSFSPDSTRIAFTSDHTGTFDIFTINVDGTGEQQVTTNLFFSGALVVPPLPPTPNAPTTKGTASGRVGQAAMPGGSPDDGTTEPTLDPDILGFFQFTIEDVLRANWKTRI